MNKFLDNVPLFPITLAIILGIATSNNHINYQYILIILITISILTLAFLIFRKSIYREINKYISILIPAIFLFCLSYFNTNRVLPIEYDYTPYSSATVEIDRIKSTNQTTTIIANIINLNDTLNNTTKVNNLQTIIFVSNLVISSLEVGDIVEIPARFKPIINRNNPYEFDYTNYMYKNQIAYSTFCQAEEIKVIGNKTSIKSLTQKLRKYLILRISKSELSTESQAFIRGVILGEQNRYSEQVRDKFEAAGIAHVLAVSGLHVGIIFFILNILLRCIRITRTHRYIILIFILIFYCFFTEGSPSVIRATIMLSIYAIFTIFHRKGVTLNNTCIAAIIILLLQPLDLYNIGFQLSFLSVIAISLFTRELNPFHQWQPIPFYIANLFTLSISATLGTLAIICYYFHSLPVAFLLANVTIVPLLPFIFLLGIICFILPNSQFICNCFDAIYQQIINYLSWIESTPILAPIQNINIDIPEVIIYTTAILLLAIFIRNRNIKLLITSIILITSSIFITYYRSNINSGENLYILNDHNALTIFYHKNHNGYLIFSDHKKLERFKKEYHNLIVKSNIKDITVISDTLNNGNIHVNYPYIQLDTIRMIIINTQIKKIFPNEQIMDTVNYQVIADGYYGTLKDLTKYITTDSTILTSSMNYNFGGRMVRESDRDSIPTHYTKRDGAWRYNILNKSD